MSVPDNVDAETGEILEPGANDRTVAALAKVEPIRSALVRTAGPWAAIEIAFKEHQELVKRLLDDSDYQEIQGKKFPKKSAWRKLAVAYGVSFEIVDRGTILDDDNQVTRADFIVRATAPNGRFADGWGACSAYERCCQKGCRRGGNHKHCPAAEEDFCPGRTHFSHAEHDIPATAETRAKNRAASDLFGMGEVSAEEVVSRDEPKRRTQTKKPELATEPQIKKLVIVAKEAGFIEEERHEAASKALNRHIVSFKELTKQEASKLIEEWSGLHRSIITATKVSSETAVPQAESASPTLPGLEHGDHDADWIPSPNREGLEVCAVEGCGRGRKKP